MQLADSVPEKNPSADEEIYGGELFFYETEEELQEIVRENASPKMLFLSDPRGIARFSPVLGSPRILSVVYDGDCLPLFTMPDGVSRVFASGGRDVLHAARWFAGVQGIPCYLFPESATLEGAVEERGEISVAGEKFAARFPHGRIYRDRSDVSSLARAYARLLLARLACFEARALTAFGEKRELPEVSLPDRTDPESLIRANARDLDCGEGGVLASLFADDPLPEWRAYILLSALYAAFFERGKPRRYFTPDYRARALRAGTPIPDVPSREEYALRAIALERERATLAKEILSLADRREEFCQTIRSLSAQPIARGGDLERLKLLPELAGRGLSAVIRDFGLMEWK